MASLSRDDCNAEADVEVMFVGLCMFSGCGRSVIAIMQYV